MKSALKLNKTLPFTHEEFTYPYQTDQDGLGKDIISYWNCSNILCNGVNPNTAKYAPCGIKNKNYLEN